MLISTHISRTSAILLFAGGVMFLYAPGMVLPRLVPSFPVSGEWIGQLLAASWLALSGLNWLNRLQIIGGIYNRAMVTANAMFYFIAATVLVKRIAHGGTPAAVWLLVAPIFFLALVYVWLLFRGPLQRDLEAAGKAG